MLALMTIQDFRPCLRFLKDSQKLEAMNGENRLLVTDEPLEVEK
jgi:hypothetical protein